MGRENNPATHDKKHRFILPILAIVTLVVGMAAASFITHHKKQTRGITSIGGEFELQSINGPVRLSDFQGNVVALYFGFASCPDVCPTSLGILATALRQLSPKEQSQIQPVFISVDPERDTPEMLAEYTDAFYPGMLGLTSDQQEIDIVTRNYRTLYKMVPLEDSALDYTVDHASIIYIIGRNGIVQSLGQHGVTPEQLVEKLRDALKNT